MTTITPSSIPPSELEAELAKIWEGFEGKKTTRASLFNLIFVTSARQRESYMQAITDKVVEKFPSRVLFITIDKEKTPYLRTYPSVLPCGDHQRDIACDFIKIEVGGSFEERLPFLILPHILTDLPIYVIWAGEPIPSPFLSSLQAIATRMIFDAEATTNLQTFAKALLEIHTPSVQPSPSSDIADLSWGRIESWRDLLTSLFYAQEKLSLLEQCKEISICYNTCESPFYHHPQIQALYLQGWLAAQLEWKLQKKVAQSEGLKLFYKTASVKELTVSLIAENNPAHKPGSLFSLSITTEQDLHILCARNPKAFHHIKVTLSTPDHCDLPLTYIFSKDESGKSLVKEICHKQTSSHYLRLLTKMAGGDLDVRDA